MAIVSSSFVLGHLQVDGRRYVREVHIDSQGDAYVRDYLAVANADYEAIMNARATAISNELADAEIEGLLNG